MASSLDAESDSGVPSPRTAFNEYEPLLQQAILLPTRQAFTLPKDIAFQRTLDKKFANDIGVLSTRVLSLTDKLLRFANGGDAKGKGKPIVHEEDNLTEGYHTSVVDILDQLFEGADSVLDSLTGQNKPAAIAVNESATRPQQRKPKPGRLDASLLHAANLPKPQLVFRTPIDNSNSYVWRPTVTTKYNAQVPLGYTDPELQEGREDLTPEQNALLSLHPYRYEITHTTYPARLLVPPPTPIPNPPPLTSTPLTYVRTLTDFQAMLAKLKLASEIAVDLEHHDYRTYYGFVCLMQVSTREEDWIVDTLVPEVRAEMESLNEVFTDPKIVKVFHGAESDIVWLQQDFNLYVVNLFDTYHASVLLGGFPKNGLASLLEYFCGFEADKRYQLADWRIRPLPEDMLYYARSDTHFLLFIYDNLRNLLLLRQQSGAGSSSTPSTDSTYTPLQKVLAASENTALRVWDRELYDAETGRGTSGWAILLKKYAKSNMSPRTRAVIIAVHVWRDGVARECDESTKYVLPFNQIFRLADAITSSTSAGLSGLTLSTLFRALSPTPPLVRERASELLQVVKRALEEFDAGSLSNAGTSAAAVAAVAAAEDPGVALGESRMDLVDDSAQENSKLKLTFALPDLWGRGSNTSGIETSSSSLFGPTSAQPTTPAPSYSAPSSSLFGNIHPTSVASSAPSSSSAIETDHTRYLEIVRRIHSTLVVIPTIPSLQPKNLAPTEASIPDPNVLAMPAEVAFVPRTERTTIPSPSTLASTSTSTSTVVTRVDPNSGDTLVVVGRRDNKKRKRKAGLPAEDEELAADSPSDVAGPSTTTDSKMDVDSDNADLTALNSLSSATAGGSGSTVNDAKGKKKEKKKGRKQALVASTEAGSGSSTPAGSAPGTPLSVSTSTPTPEDFDYSTAPNLVDLDEASARAAALAAAEDGGRKKKKQKREKKAPVIEYGNFHTPRNRAEPRSGNVSHSFK